MLFKPRAVFGGSKDVILLAGLRPASRITSLDQMVRNLSLYSEEIELNERKPVGKVQKLPSLHRAVQRRKIKPFFTRNTALVKVDEHGRTALHLAASEGHFRTF